MYIFFVSEISVDEETFKNYEKSNGKLKEITYGRYHENPIHEDSLSFGFMNVKDGVCPFLDNKKLCEIHKNVGEESLAITCKRYPRVYNIVDGVYEMSGVPSCIEICNSGFLSREKLEFIEIEGEIEEESIQVLRLLDTDGIIDEDSLVQYFWNLRILTINIMQNRDYKIEERLNILKELYAKILIYKNDYEKLEEILEQEIENPMIKKINIDTSLREMLLSKKFCNKIRSTKFKDILNIYKKEGNNIKNLEDLKKYDYIMENYLVNQIFKNLIPFNRGEDIEKSLDELINNYKILKVYIEEMALSIEEKISEDLIIRIIQGLSKDLEHNKVFLSILKS